MSKITNSPTPVPGRIELGSDICLCGHMWSSHGRGSLAEYMRDLKKPCTKEGCDCEAWELTQKRLI